MAYEVIWTLPANRDLDRMINYLLKTEPMVVEKVVDRMLKAIKRLKNTPFRGEIYGKGNGDEIRALLVGSYRVFFRVSESDHHVEILKLWHTSRDEPNLDDM